MPKTPTDIRSLARSHAPSMMRVLLAVARQKNAPAAARVAAANSVLDRGYGKADQQHMLDADIQITIRKLFVDDALLVDVTPKSISDETK